MGLLDFFQRGTEEEERAKTAMAQGLLGSGSNLQRMAGGMSAYQQSLAKAKAEEEARRMREQEMQMRAMQMQQAQEQMRRQAEAAEIAKAQQMTQQRDEGLMRRLAGMPIEQQMPPGAMGPGQPMQNSGIDPRTFLNQGGSMGGLKAAMELSQALSPKTETEKPLVSNPGQIARHPITGAIMWQNPVEAKEKALPTSVQEFNYAKENPAFAAWLTANNRSKATNVNVGGAVQEKEESKTVGKYFGDQYGRIQDSGFAGNKTLGRLDNLESLLTGYQTGKLTPVGTDIAAYAKAAGFNIDPKLGNKQAAEAISNEMALELRNPAGGAGMPGAMSDKDREFLVKMTAGLSKDPQANKLIIETRRKLAKRDIEVAKMARAYRQKHGGMDDGFLAELEQFSYENPLFPQADGGVYDQADAILKRGRNGNR